ATRVEITVEETETGTALPLRSGIVLAAAVSADLESTDADAAGEEVIPSMSVVAAPPLISAVPEAPAAAEPIGVHEVVSAADPKSDEVGEPEPSGASVQPAEAPAVIVEPAVSEASVSEASVSEDPVTEI